MIYTQDEIETLEASAIDREKLVLEVDSLKKENKELRELLREGCELMKIEIYTCKDNDPTWINFLDHPEVKALLERNKV